MSDLFSKEETQSVRPPAAPLAERVRPKTLEEYVGQDHLTGPGKPLRLMLDLGDVNSMILWGPPGVGKTTLARLIANHVKAEFHQLNAVAAGVKEVREVISRAEKNLKGLHKRTILFIDEIHRFNKAQQDALLHSVEEGTITLIGATTENPSFEVISPLLSRCQVYILESLGREALNRILDQALSKDPLLAKRTIEILDRDFLMLLSGGDARKLLNGLENAIRLTKPNANGSITITKQKIEDALQRKFTLYDKEGEQHYDIISAFIKSVRGSDPDAAVYWMARMLDGGEDPKFIARRMIVLASEDIGNADPYGLTLATSCFTAVDYIGMPEARIILAQTAVYLASCPKSNASYKAIEGAWSDVRNVPNLPVPLHIRNAPTKLMDELGYGKEYKYSHDFPGHFIEQQFLPENLKEKLYYRPSENGREKDIRERLNKWWKKKQR
ncbi:MAG: replication-associated recombination protein A [Ignavibacteriae bacterium]|nr:MAG: replication-associated recombination protein A [Ignavibacteriota bacterium]